MHYQGPDVARLSINSMKIRPSNQDFLEINDLQSPASNRFQIPIHTNPSVKHLDFNISNNQNRALLLDHSDTESETRFLSPQKEKSRHRMSTEFKLHKSGSEFGDEEIPKKFYSSNQLKYVSNPNQHKHLNPTQGLIQNRLKPQPRQSFEYNLQGSQRRPSSDKHQIRHRKLSGSLQKSFHSQGRKSSTFGQSGVSRGQDSGHEYSFRTFGT